DPTEGGLATGLLELATASGCGVEVHGEKIPVLTISGGILKAFSMDPLGALASGSLIVCCRDDAAEVILNAWDQAGIAGTRIGTMTASPELVLYRHGKTSP